MPTAAEEFRAQARQCLKLASEAKEPHVKAALLELAQKLTRDAHQAERRERDLAMYLAA